MKSRMVKRILATLLAVVFLAGDVLPTVASDVEGSTQVIKEAEEETSSLWEEVTPAEGENKENESETPTAPATTETPATTEPTESEEKTEASTEETELTEIGEGETPLADGLDEKAELKEGEEVVEEAEEDDYVILEHPAVDGVTVTVKAAAGVIPENTYVEVIELDDPVEVEEIISTITELENGETAENEEVVVKRYKAFDITLYVDDEEGNKTVVEPADREKVTVSFAGDMIVPEDGEDIAIYHVDDNDTSNVEKMEEVAVTTDENDEQVVELETDHFSKYVVTYTERNKSKNDWSSVSGELRFQVVDENNNPIPNCWFVLNKNRSSISKSSYPATNTLFETDSQGILTLEIKEASSNNATKTHVLKQLSSDSSHQRVSDEIKITESTSRVKNSNTYNLTRTFNVEIKDGDSQNYTGNPIVIKNLAKTTNSNNDDPGNLDSVSKTAELVDWSNRVYKLDLNAVVGRTKTNLVSKVVIVTDASGSMTFVDVNPLNLKTNRVYFSNGLSDYGKWTNMSSNAKARLPEYRRSSYNSNDYGTYALAPTEGSYYFYDASQGAWFTRNVTGLQNSNCYDWTEASRVSDISSVTLYTDRGEVLIDSIKEFIDGLPDGTKVEFIKFGDKDQFNNGYVDVSGGFKTVGTDDVAIQGYIEKMNPVGFTGTYPEYALKRTLDSYYKWYEDNTDCNLVFFADGASDGDSSKENQYANLIKSSGVDVYSVGLKTKDGVLERVASSSDKIYTCNESESLAQAMQGISSEVSSKTHGVLIDEIDSHFEICTATGSTDSADVNSAYPGASISENSITWNDAEFTVGGTTHQYVYVKAKDDFAGGNVVPTNGTLTVSLNNVTKTATSPLVNVKGEVDANDQEDTIKRGQTLEEYIEKHLAKVWDPEEQETEEGEEPKDPRFTTAKDSDYADVVIKFYEDEEHKKEITLENLKKATPEEDTTYYVVVEAVPKTTGANAQSQVGSAMTQDGTYYYMDRELENHQREAVKEAEYKIIVKGYDLLVETTKTADWKDGETKSWADRTYKVELGAETFNKVTTEGEHVKTIKTPVKVVFLLDVSSSMRNSKDQYGVTALTKLQNQTKSFIEGLPLESEVAVVSFWKSAAINVPLTKIDSENKRNEILRNVSLPTDKSGTRANEGLKIIESQILPQKDKKYEKTYIVFFTDGDTYVGDSDYANYPGKTRDERDAEHDRQATANAKKLKDRGVEIFSVGMGNIHPSLLNSVATDSSHVYSGEGASSIATNFDHIYDTISTPGKEETEPVAVDNIKFYDEVSKYFVLIDENGNPLRTGDTFDGGVVGEKNGLQTITWTGLSSTEKSDGNFGVSKTIYLKAKDEFAGGNGVPTNADFVVTVEDPDSEDEAEEYKHETPYVDVNCVATPGEKEDTIFLGEAVSSVLGVEGKLEEVENAMANDSYADDMFVFVTKSDVEWYTDEACEHSITLEDLLALKPTKETPFYGKVTYTPSSSVNSPANKLQEFSVTGKYTIKVVNGKITVTKTINVTDAEKKLKYDGQPIFTFNLKKDGQVVQTKVIYFDDFATGTKSVTFDKLGKGYYSVEELSTAGWELTSSEGNSSILISQRSPEGSCKFANKPVKQKAFADKDVVVNSITKNEDGTISFNKKKGSN